MTREEAREAAKVLEAYAAGKTVQTRSRQCGEVWTDCENPSFAHWRATEYRIKPEPRVVWVNEHEGRLCDTAHETEVDAVASAHPTPMRQCKFIEVID